MKREMIVLGMIALGLASCVSRAKRLEAQQEKDPQYQYEKAVVCLQYNVPDDAFKYLNQALALDPKHYLSYNLLGLAHIVKGNLPQAKEALLRCIEIKPDFSEAHNNLGTVYQELGDVARAEAEFKKAFEIDQNYNASYNLAKLDYEANKFEPALGYVQKSLQRYQRSVIAWNLQGLIYDSLEKYPEAILSYQQALKLVPNEANVSYNLGAAYFKNGDTAKAKDILEKTLPQAKTEDLRSRIQDLLKRLK